MAHQERNQESTVYIGNLDERVTDELIWELMLQAGPVENVHLPKDRVTQSHQGYGFCEFKTREDAIYAIDVMNQIKLYTKPLRINLADSNRKELDIGANLFIGNLDPDVDETSLRNAFSQFGGNILQANIAIDPETGNSKGYGFVSYDDFDVADEAEKIMNGAYLMNKQIKVSFAMKKDGSGELHGSEAERLLARQAKVNKVALGQGNPGGAMMQPYGQYATAGYPAEFQPPQGYYAYNQYNQHPSYGQ